MLPTQPTCTLARRATAALAMAIVAWASPPALAQQTGVAACGDPFKNHFGPWDFRSARREDLEIVEKVHFTPRIERLERGERVLADDISYTLGVFPNHHRALSAIARLSLRDRTDKPEKSYFTVECWFDRAVRFRPDDNVARVLYAQWLAARNRRDDARRQLEAGVQQAGPNALSHFNIGLMYMELGDHERALQQAHRAQALGYQRPELMNLLKRANAWRDPAPAAEAAPGAASAPAAAAAAASAPRAP
jgi:tetratricopeptide (TPR) repeat protein